MCRATHSERNYLMDNNTTRFTIRDIPCSVTDKLDSIAKAKNYQSRNQLIVDILAQYVAVEDELFAQALTSVVKSMCKSEINYLQEQSVACVRTMALATARLLKTSQRLEEMIVDDTSSTTEYSNTIELLNSLNLTNKDLNTLSELLSK